MKKINLYLTCLLSFSALFWLSQAPLRAQDSPPEYRSFDEDLMLLAEAVHGLGGLYYDQEGTLNAWLLDADRLSQEEVENTTAHLIEAVESLWGEEFWSHGRGGPRPEDTPIEPFGVPEIKLLPAAFDLFDLGVWHQAANEAFALPGVIFTDLDETRNRVSIGISDAADAEEVTSLVTSLGVPEEAILLEVTEKRTPGATLTTPAWPIEGGRRIGAGGAGCSLGWATTNGNGIDGFLTAAHCSSVHGQVDGTIYTQPGGAQIGVEMIDAPFRSGGGCPSGTLCKWSDANFARYTASTPFEAGHISRTLNWRGSKTINPANPRFKVVGSGTVAAGNWVDKVGATTGWTYGFLDRTCVNFQWGFGLPSHFIFLCSHWVKGYGDVMPMSAGGDSGSPTFSLLNPTDAGRVRTLGILHSVAPDSFIYSPMNGLRRDGLIFSASEPPEPPEACPDYPYCP